MDTRRHLEWGVLSAPMVIFLLLFLGFPALVNIVYSLSNVSFQTLRAPELSGFANYAAVLTDGLEAVDAACLEILTQGMGSSDAVLNAVARARHPDPGAPIDIPQALTLTREPVADCARYDRLRQVA